MRLLRWSSTSWRDRPVLNERGEVIGHVRKELDEMDLTPNQKTALKELRGRVGHKLRPPHDSDFEILKWLAARDFDVDRAEEMLLKHLQWRTEWEIDSILDWVPPEVLTNHYPVGLSGYDKGGSPVWIIPYGRCDMRGLLHSCHKRDYIKYTVQILERSLENMRTKSEALEVPIRRQCCVFDLEHFSIGHVTWKPAMDVILQLVQMYEMNYPEVLKSALIINAPKIFTAAYAIIKPFLDEVTLGKIQIHGRTGWQGPILENVEADQLPAHWGGTMRDADGDDMCPSKICLGGSVPKHYYLKRKKGSGSPGHKTDHLKSLILPKTGKEIIELEVTQPGTELRWEFQSDDFDVGFGISRWPSPAEEQVLLPPQRVDSHLVPEEGSIVCTDPGIYKVTFDNEFSYLRSKKLYYSLKVFPPTEHTKF